MTRTKPSDVVVLVLFFCLSLSLSTPSSATPPEMKLTSQEIKQVCSTSGDPSFCTKFLTSTPGVAGTDLLGAAKISLKQAAAKAAATDNVITSLLGSAGGDAKMKARLEDCSEYFQDAVRSILGSLGKLDGKDYCSVLTYISAALDAGDNCSDEFQDPPAIPPTLEDGVHVLPKICSVILAVVTKLKGPGQGCN